MNNIEQMICKMSGNPMLGHLVKLAKNGDTKSVENFARNLCQEKGMDFDKEFAKFMKNFKR